MLFQTSMCLFVLLNTKEDIWMNVLIKQISFPIDYGSQWGMKSVWGMKPVTPTSHFNHSSKYLPLCSAEEIHSYRFETS